MAKGERASRQFGVRGGRWCGRPVLVLLLGHWQLHGKRVLRLHWAWKWRYGVWSTETAAASGKGMMKSISAWVDTTGGGTVLHGRVR